MLLKTLAAGAALAALVVAGAADAAPKTSRSAYPITSPKRPIPYSQLDTYLKASPKLRASTDWWADTASTGSAANTAAIVSATGGPSAGKLIDPLLTPKNVAPPKWATATKKKK
ncbi:MAG: hypothetical protein JWP92_2374 [Caulobacter sp.]|nr:hypothetical protein [Caulobacter sp.]